MNYKVKIRNFFRELGIDIRRIRSNKTHEWSVLASSLREICDKNPSQFEVSFLIHCMKHCCESQSQIFQDMFVDFVLNSKENGFFVEFGATDGINLSNSYFFERRRGWTGILAEPSKQFHHILGDNRTAKIDTRCVWKESGKQIQFLEVGDTGVSTIESFSKNDNRSFLRKETGRYDVETISLVDLLLFHNAPKNIDYLSIDTEGSEYDILQAIDFDSVCFSVITVEHNYTGAREKISSLLRKAGYINCLSGFSQCDDWYVHQSILSQKELN